MAPSFSFDNTAETPAVTPVTERNREFMLTNLYRVNVRGFLRFITEQSGHFSSVTGREEPGSDIFTAATLDLSPKTLHNRCAELRDLGVTLDTEAHYTMALFAVAGDPSDLTSYTCTAVLAKDRAAEGQASSTVHLDEVRRARLERFWFQGRPARVGECQGVDLINDPQLTAPHAHDELLLAQEELSMRAAQLKHLLDIAGYEIAARADDVA